MHCAGLGSQARNYNYDQTCFAGDGRLSGITTAIPTVAVAVMTQRFLHRSDHGIRVTAATSLRSICSWVSWSDMSTKSLYAARVKFPLRRGRRFALVAIGRCDFSGAADPRDPARSACSRPCERIEPDPAMEMARTKQRVSPMPIRSQQ